MGYISIPAIKAEFPIYHGTDEEVLNIAAGHLQGSSFPVGGSDTHAVISAHRGLPSAKLSVIWTKWWLEIHLLLLYWMKF